MRHRTGVECRIAVVSVCASLLGLSVAHAQDEADVTEVIVTGSRIKQNDFDAPTPTVAISADTIERSGATNLTDFLRSMPALISSEDDLQNTGSQGYIGSTGLNLLNLRNLGEERTLVLVDGRRHVAQLPETAAVDINTIPIDLIERVDIVTGGVSAVYGADAVSGVVNFVMKKDFEGMVGRVQYGGADAGGAYNTLAALTGGLNFADGRGNISGSIQHTDRGRLQARQRSYLRGTNYTAMRANPDDLDDDPNLPDEVPLNDTRFFDSAPGGAIDVDFDGIPDTLPDGSAYQIPRFVPPYYSQGGSGTPTADYIGDLLPEARTTVASVFGHFNVSDSVNVFGEAKFVHGKANAYGQPTFDFSLFQSVDNPFLPASVAAQIVPGLADEVFGDPDNPGLVPDGVLMNRDNFDLGVRGEDVTRDTMRFVAGVNGAIGERYEYEVSYTYGQSDIDTIALNNRYNDRFLAAIDVVTDPSTGQATCRSNLDPSTVDSSGTLSFTPGPTSGCRPLNIFGQGVADPAAIAWVMLNNKATSRMTQNVFNAFVGGPVPGVTLPAGDIDAVVGVEWRREGSRSEPPLADRLGQTFGNVILPTDGDFDVKETFAEVRIPVLADKPFAQMLQVSGAVRVSDYSTVGSTTTWNTGLLWAPVRDVSFRSTVAESVRAPNIAELFSPQNQTFGRILDPCAANQLANGTSYRVANCAAILSSLGVSDPSVFRDLNSFTLPGIASGNASLSEETARSYTFGVVFRPRFAEGLALAIDYYDINIKQAINTASAQEVANNCVDQPTIDNVFCDSLTREAFDPDGPTSQPRVGSLSGFVVQPENVASFRTRGIDFNLNYRLDPLRFGMADIGKFTFSLIGSRLDRLTTIPTLGAEQIDQRTTADLETGDYAPKWTTVFDTSWEFRGLTLSYGYNYFSKTTRYTLQTLAGNPDQASRSNIYYNAHETHDLTASYDFEAGYRVYGGVTNLTDERPDYTTIYPVSPVGRAFYAGVRVSFGGR